VSALDDLYERAVMGLVTRVPGPLVALIAMLFYPGIGLLVPVALNWPLAWLVDANVIGVSLAASIIIGWLSLQIGAAKRRHLVEWTTDLRQLNSEEFEWLVGETFRREGWKVTHRGRQDAPDGNIDLELVRNGQHKIVQCKRWESWHVPVDEIRKFIGTATIAGLPSTSGVFVTLSDFTPSAIEEARKAGVELIGGRVLYERIAKVRRKEPCPVCGTPMHFDHSQRGWWFRCVATGCTGKRDVGNDAGRAIEFLTEAPVAR